MNVKTSFEYPPIPVRQYDWMAYFPDLGEDGPTGRGENEADALRDLASQVGDLWQEKL